jgi:hypothetical protein
MRQNLYVFLSEIVLHSLSHRGHVANPMCSIEPNRGVLLFRKLTFYVDMQHAAKSMCFTSRNYPPHFVTRRSCCETYMFYRTEMQNAAKPMRLTERNRPPHFVPKRSCCEPHAFYRAKSRCAFVQKLKLYGEIHKVAKTVFYRTEFSSTFCPRAVMLRNLCVFSSQIVVSFYSEGCRHAECGKTYVLHRANLSSTLCPKAVMLRTACVLRTTSRRASVCFCSKA